MTVKWHRYHPCAFALEWLAGGLCLSLGTETGSQDASISAGLAQEELSPLWKSQVPFRRARTGEERSAAHAGRSSMERSCGTSTVRQEEALKNRLQSGDVQVEDGEGWGAGTRDPAVGGALAVGHGRAWAPRQSSRT